VQSPLSPAIPAEQPEPFLTVKDAAKALGLPYAALQRAVRAGLVPSYTSLSNKRRRVRISEISAAVEASTRGGQ
jgi:predicted site-specific integrase-resolvase